MVVAAKRTKAMLYTGQNNTSALTKIENTFGSMSSLSTGYSPFGMSTNFETQEGWIGASASSFVWSPMTAWPTLPVGGNPNGLFIGSNANPTGTLDAPFRNKLMGKLSAFTMYSYPQGAAPSAPVAADWTNHDAFSQNAFGSATTGIGAVNGPAICSIQPISQYSIPLYNFGGGIPPTGAPYGIYLTYICAANYMATGGNVIISGRVFCESQSTTDFAITWRQDSAIQGSILQCIRKFSFKYMR